MRKPEALFIALAAATSAFAVAFVYPIVGSLPVPWYYPLEHRWAYESKPTGLAMDFYGRAFLATMAWCAVFMMTLPIARRVRGSPRVVGLSAAWTITMVMLVMFYYGWMLYFRVPEPAAIPDWYEPR